MARSNYETLLNQYNRLVARYKDLDLQIKEREHAWGEQEKKYKHTIIQARSLCEMVLAKEQDSASFLGKEYSYGSIPDDDLIAQAKQVFIIYNNERTKMELALQKKLEETEATLENLKTQYAFLQSHAAEVAKDIQDDPNAVIETPELPEVQQEQQPKIANYKAQKAVESGELEIAVISEDEDITVDDLRQQGEMAEINTEFRLAEGKPIVKASKVVRETMQKITDNTAITATGGTIEVNIDELCSKISERRKNIVKIIGETGLFLASEILEKLQESGEMKQSTFRNDVFALKTSGVLKVESISVPVLMPRGNSNELTPAGAAVFKRLFGKDPVEPKSKQIIRDHDNLEHGLGIMVLADILSRFNAFTAITTERKENTIVLDTGDKYIPDIIAKGGRIVAYFEYERATHRQADFNIKMNKMCRKTRYLNIVTNNNTNAEELCKKSLEWVKSRGGFGCLPGYILRITTMDRLDNASKNKLGFQERDCWSFWYDLGKTEEEQVQTVLNTH